MDISVAGLYHSDDRKTRQIRTLDRHGRREVKWDELGGIETGLAAMGAMEDIYPQMLSTIYIRHAPAWIQIRWRIFPSHPSETCR